MTARLERRRTTLQRQFSSMESTIAKLQTQQSTLGSIQATG
jgi:flagellar capping protein FliD